MSPTALLRSSDTPYIPKDLAMSSGEQRLYHLIAVNDRSGRRHCLTSYPMRHEECMTMARRFNLHKAVRLLVEQLDCTRRRSDTRDAGALGHVAVTA